MKDDALYLEVDEDITSAIDKLSKTTGAAVQIVVPKRSSMLQSIINLKLLKKAAENSGKNLVLVTNDKLATELAGRIGLAVAPSLGAKAVLADAKAPPDLKTGEEIIEADDPEPPRAPEPPVRSEPTKRPLLKRRPLSDTPLPDPAGAATDAVTDADTTPAAAGGKLLDGPKVPNFHRLQRRLLWVGLALVLIVGYSLGMYLFTTAKVTLYANGTKVDIDTGFTVDPGQAVTNQADAVLAGQLVTVSKDLTGPFTPTGKQDAGTKATGTVSFQNCEDSNVYPFAKGNTIVSQGLSFTTNDAITIPAGTFTGGGTHCTSPSVSVGVTAAQNGDNYNLTSASFASSKLTSNFKVTGSLSGGTSKIVTIITQPDLDTENTALVAKDKSNVAPDLASHVPSGYIAMPASQNTAVSNVNPTPDLGAVATSATLSLHITYTELVVKKDDYAALVRAQELKQVGSQNQIYDDGLSAAQVTATPADASGRQEFHLTTEAFGGAKLDTAAIAKQLAGKRYGDAADAASGLPGISRADIALWPGWATSLPSRTGKISVTIRVAGNQ